MALVILGIAAYAITAAIDVYYGQSTTVSEKGRYLQGASVFLVPCFTFAFTSLSGFLFNSGRWLWGIGIFGVLACYMAYSASNGIGFVATETIGKSRLVETKIKQTADVTSLQNAQAMKTREETTEWLKRVYVSERKGDDKERVLAKLAEVTSAPVAIQQATPESAIADAKAVVFSKWLGWDVEDVQIANAAWLVGLLIMGKLLGPTLGFGFWPRSHAAERWKDRPPKAKMPGNVLESSQKLSKDEAREDIKHMVALGAKVGSGKELSLRWGVGEGTVSKWLGDFRREGLIKREANGNARAIVGLHRGNGSLKAI